MEEKILNTVSKSKASNYSGEFEAELSVRVDFQKSEEQIGDNYLELNKVSVDEVEFLDSKTRKNGVEGIECELLINHSNDIDFELDLDGSLNVSGKNIEKYSVNEMGELILQL